MLGLARSMRLPALHTAASRQFHASAAVAKRNRGERKIKSVFDSPPVVFEDLTTDDEDPEHDISAAGHLWLRQQRRMLYYMRLIEHEVPQLVGELHSGHSSMSP
jgi:hypothetical protein